MKRVKLRSLWRFFFYALTLQLTCPILFPCLRLNFFVPFIIKAFYHCKFTICLWLALLCGCIIDLLAYQSRFGLFALTYVLTTIVLYRQKKNFFEDHFYTIPLMTFLFSIVSSLFFVFNATVLDKPLSLPWQWIFTDLIIMSFADSIYAFSIFVMPTFWKRSAQAKEEECL